MKTIAKNVYYFDAEWVPCDATGRLLLNMPDSATEAEIRHALWQRAGATAENPRPFLKLALSRVVSISAVHRLENPDGNVTLTIRSWPSLANHDVSEREIVGGFLEEVASNQGQLVGFNSQSADLPILFQRGVATGAHCLQFGRRPEKPWLGVDYQHKFSEGHIDLMQVLNSGGFGRGSSTPSLDEIAAAAKIPGKLGCSGASVIDLWDQRQYQALTSYNETDACTTYLLWLRIAWFLGKFSADQVRRELATFRQLLHTLAPARPHLSAFIQEWEKRSPSSRAPAPRSQTTKLVRVTAACPGRRQWCVVWVDMDIISPDLELRMKRHLLEDGQGGFFLCEIGYDSDGNIATGRKDGGPYLLEVDTPDLRGIARSVSRAVIHGQRDAAA